MREAVQLVGGAVEDEHDPQAKRTIVWVRLAQGATNNDLKKLPAIPFFFGLDLKGTKVSDTWLKEMANLKNLTSVDLRGTKVTDAGLKNLANLKHLSAALPRFYASDR